MLLVIWIVYIDLYVLNPSTILNFNRNNYYSIEMYVYMYIYTLQ